MAPDTRKLKCNQFDIVKKMVALMIRVTKELNILASPKCISLDNTFL